MLGVEGRQLNRTATPDFLVQLGQLPTDGQRAVGIVLGEQPPASPQGAAGDSNATSVCDAPTSIRSSSARLRGKKPTKRPVLRGQARGDNRREHTARARQHLDRQPGLDASPHELVTRVRYERHPGVGHERDHRTLARSARRAPARARARCARDSSRACPRSRSGRAARACVACPRRRSRPRRAGRRARVASRRPGCRSGSDTPPAALLRHPGCSSEEYRVPPLAGELPYESLETGPAHARLSRQSPRHRAQ